MPRSSWLLFLGTVLLIGASFLVLFYGAVRRSSFFARLGAGAALTIAAGYFILLSGVSFASSEEVLRPALEIFCEIDCHLAYSLIGARNRRRAGPGDATGLRTRLICSCSSKDLVWRAHHLRPSRQWPLAPNGRKVILSMHGRSFAPSPEGQAAFARLIGFSTPLTTLLRPGEVLHDGFRLRCPRDLAGSGSQSLRRPRSRLVIGHENSPSLLWG